DQCTSGNCVEGICCNSACTGACQTCSQWLKADNSADGTCGPVTTGTACGPAPNACLSGIEYELTPTCDANGECQQNTIECANGFACVGDTGSGFCAVDCREDAEEKDDRCIKDRWCDTDGSCKADLVGGSACTKDAQCNSNEC